MTKSAAPSPEDLNPFHMAAQQFARAVGYLPGLKKGLIDFLERPAKAVTLEFPIEIVFRLPQKEGSAYPGVIGRLAFDGKPFVARELDLESI